MARSRAACAPLFLLVLSWATQSEFAAPAPGPRAVPAARHEGGGGAALWGLRLRGGGTPATVVFPPAGPPTRDGSLRKCAQCGSLETQSTLGHCKITELFFCAGTECRRKHWLANKQFWRDKVTDTPVTLSSGMPLPVAPSHNRDGQLFNDDSTFPGDRVDAPPEAPEREFGEPAPPLNPLEHKWDEDNDGINKVLWDAAAHNNLELLAQAVRQGAAVNAGNPYDLYRWNSLHRAAYKGSLEAVETLIGLGADVHATDAWRKTALHLAAEMDQVEICTLLLDKGANVNAYNKNNQTALHYAARDGGAEICKLLIERGADPDVVDLQPWGRHGLTALDYAMENAWGDVVKVLDGVTTVRTNLTAEVEEEEDNRRANLRDYSPYQFFKDDVDLCS